MTQHRVCDQCPAVRLVTETDEIELEVEPGMMDGMTQKFSGRQSYFYRIRYHNNLI